MSIQSDAVVVSLVTGFLLGLGYFGGLWWTVRRAVDAQAGVVVYLLSFILRTALVLVGFYLLALHYGPHVVLGVVGFIVTRLLLTRSIGAVALQRKEGHP